MTDTQESERLGTENLRMEAVNAVTYEDEDGRIIRRSWDDGEIVEEVVDRVA